MHVCLTYLLMRSGATWRTADILAVAPAVPIRALMGNASSEGRYKALFDGLDEAVCFIEPVIGRPDGQRDYRYVEMNAAMLSMFGVADLSGQTIRDNFPDEVENWYDDYDRTLSTGVPTRFQRRSDPQGMVIDMFISRVDQADRPLLMVVMRDVTAAADAENALRRSRTELETLNETLERRVEQRTEERDRMWNFSPDLMVEASLDGVYHRANPAWKTILGYDPSEVIGRTAEFFTHADDLGAMFEALATAQAATLPSVDLRFRHRDGSYRWIQWVAAPGFETIFALGRDVTDAAEAKAALARTEEQLRQSQKMEAIGQLTGGVAHDFNNLLTVISGATEMLKRPGIAEEKRERYIDNIADTAKRAATLTSHLLAFSRRRAVRPEVIDLNLHLDATAEILQRSLGGHIDIAVHPAPGIARVEVDPAELETAVLNAAVNARHAMPNGGTLTISVRDAFLGAQAGLAIEFVDTGSGMSKESVERAFEPFYTTKPVGEGTGLGLSQIHGFAAQAGGSAEILSELGVGTTLRILLPRADKLPSAIDHGRVLAEVPQGLKVLLVEDNEQVRQFAEQLLSDLGTEVVSAASGIEALAILQEQPFELVFSDVVMPEMSGIDLARQLRIREPELPVLLATGYSQQMLKESGFPFPILTKPYGADTLSAAIRKALAPDGEG